MANQNDRFIDEVTEDLRRDRLFLMLRRYGWIAVLLILALVAGAAWREYASSRDRAAARAFGRDHQLARVLRTALGQRDQAVEGRRGGDRVVVAPEESDLPATRRGLVEGAVQRVRSGACR